MKKPNIIYILADDLGYGDMQANHPASRIPTPHLDRLAARGMRFTDAHATSAVCTPSRYSVLTGRYAWRGKLKRNVLYHFDGPIIESDRQTIAGFYRENGYETACVGKWHLGWTWRTKDGRPGDEGLQPGVIALKDRDARELEIDYTQPMRGGPVDHGFDSYFGIDVPNFPPFAWFENDRVVGSPTEHWPRGEGCFQGRSVPDWSMEAMLPAFTERIREFISQEREKPFFLYFALTSPHTPVCPNKAFIGSSGAGIYGDFVCETDWVIGQIMDALDARGLSEDTMIIFTSDNGPETLPEAGGGAFEVARTYGHYSMADFRGVKRDTWEGGHRVPFIASWPGTIPAGAVCNELIGLQDFFATSADLLGQTLGEATAEDSQSFLPLLQDKKGARGRDHILYHSERGDFALREGSWVFIDAPTGGTLPEPAWFREERGYTAHEQPGELYNLEQDIAERTNLYTAEPDRVAAMKTRLEQIKQLKR